MIWVKRCDAYPVFDGFIYVASVKEEVRSPRCCFNCFFKMPRPFEELCQFFHWHWICGSNLRKTLVDLQRLIKIGLLVQRQTQTVESFGMVGHLLQRLPIGDSRLTPFLIPGSGVAFVHCFLENVFS